VPPHQAGYLMSADPHASAQQLLVDPRGPVRAVLTGDRGDLLEELSPPGRPRLRRRPARRSAVRSGVSGCWPLPSPPAVVAPTGTLPAPGRSPGSSGPDRRPSPQRCTGRWLRVHPTCEEGQCFPRIRSSSSLGASSRSRRATFAAAVCCSTAAAALAGVFDPRSARRSACSVARTQFEIVVGDRLNSLARSMNVRPPLRCNSTIWTLNSCE
jgi:hypothetical protein